VWPSERLPAFGALTFPSVITTSMVQDLNEKITALIVRCVDYLLRCTYRSRAKYSISNIVITNCTMYCLNLKSGILYINVHGSKTYFANKSFVVFHYIHV
jgi:hypothetical protein